LKPFIKILSHDTTSIQIPTTYAKKRNDNPSVKYIYISQYKDKIGNQQKSLIPKDKQNRKKINDITKFLKKIKCNQLYEKCKVSK